MNDFIKKIIIAVNGTQNSLNAAKYAIMMAKSCGAELKAVNVVDSATIRYLGLNQILIKEEQQDFENDLKFEGQSNLEYVKSLAILKGLEIETEQLQGKVSSEILKAAEAYNADLIILGGKEKTMYDRYHSSKAVLSTIRTEILLNSKCPVLMVQKPDIENAFKLF